MKHKGKIKHTTESEPRPEGEGSNNNVTAGADNIDVDGDNPADGPPFDTVLKLLRSYLEMLSRPDNEQLRDLIDEGNVEFELIRFY